MRCSAERAKDHVTLSADVCRWGAVAIQRVLRVRVLQQHAQVTVGMIMQRTIVVGAKKKVNVDIEEGVTRDDVPAKKIGLFRAPHHETGCLESIARDDALRESPKGGCASWFHTYHHHTESSGSKPENTC